MKLSSKLLIWFSVITVATAAVSVGISASFFDTKQQALNLSEDINAIYFKFLKLKNITNDFFAFEAIDTSFYLSGKSEVLELAQLQNVNMRQGLNLLFEKHKRSTNVTHSLKDVETALKQRDSIFATLSAFVVERGFKDYGMVGKMRTYAHKLEESPNVTKAELLSLRRREKDYLLRHEEKYIVAFSAIAQKINNHLHTLRATKDQVAKDIADLHKYNETFLKVALLDKKMGLHDNGGLKGDLNNVDKQVEKTIERALYIADYNKNRKISQIEKYFLFAVAFTLLVCFFLANILSRQITKPLSTLTRYIEGIMLSEFKSIPKVVKRIKTREIKILYLEFSQMLDQLKVNQLEKDTLIDQLTAGEKKYRDMADRLPQGLFETDNRGVLIYVNKVWEEAFGYKKSEAEFNLNIFDAITRKRKNGKDVGDERLTYRKDEVVAYKKDNSWFPALLYMDKVMVAGVHKGWRGVIVDISERYEYIKLLKREQKKARESDRLKSAFLANISHEIRTPINAIMGFTNLLKSKDFSIEERQVYHDIIEKSSQDLLDVFEDMISVSRLEADTVRLSNDTVNLTNFENEIKSYALEKSVEMQKQSIKLSYLPFEEVDEKEVVFDKERVREILERLIENAFKFTDVGKVEIGHTLLKNKLVFFVKDSGIGIPKDKQQIIFDPFRQVEESNTRAYGGTGLGLSICQGIVNQMNGDIWIESTLGEGAGFYFSIPYLPKDDAENFTPMTYEETT